MVLKANQERVTTLLKDTITLLCKNGLEFKKKFSVEALIGVTLDDNDVFLISMNELVQSDNPVPTENEDHESTPDTTDSHKSPRHRRHKRKHSNEAKEHNTENLSQPTVRVKTEPGLTAQDNDEPPGPGGNQNTKSEDIWNQNEFQTLSLTPVDDSSLQSLPNMTTTDEPQTKMKKYENSRTGEEEEDVEEGEEEEDDDEDLVFIKEEATDTPRSSCSQQSFIGNPLGSESFQNQNYSFSDMSMLSQDSNMSASMMSPQQYAQFSPRGRPRVATATNPQQQPQQQNTGDGSQQQQGAQHLPRPFEWQCPLCEKSYGDKSSLQRHHKQRHEGRYSHYCSYCNKGFQDSDCLQGHISWHTGVKEYKCDLCYTEFRYNRTLKEHMKDFHSHPNKTI